jgi:hypothetical protein
MEEDEGKDEKEKVVGGRCYLNCSASVLPLALSLFLLRITHLTLVLSVQIHSFHSICFDGEGGLERR